MSDTTAGTVLIAEAERTVADALCGYLRHIGYLPLVCQSGPELVTALENFEPDIVVLDSGLPDSDYLNLVELITARGKRTKAIVATGMDNRRVGEHALKAGAYACLTKPLALGELRIVLNKALRHARLESAFEYYQSKKAAYSGLGRLIGESPPMLALKDRIQRLLAAERTIYRGVPPAVLVTGEPGTGKELVARVIHFEGVRRRHPFVEINLANETGRQPETALFGNENGASGYDTRHKSRALEAAQGGTLFLDEIAAMGTGLQVQLLMILGNRKPRGPEDHADLDVDVRIIASTARSLESLVENGSFRADLLSRLRIIHVHLPPLRQRGDDVLLLARDFLAAQGRHHGRQKLRFTSAAEFTLRHYDWPGNVRELGNVIEQSVLRAKDTDIDSTHLMLDHTSTMSRATLFDGDQVPGGEFNLEHLERTMLTSALQRTNGNISGAARLLGLSRDTLRYRIAKYQLLSNQ